MSGDFDPPVSAVREAVARALAEDLGVLGDLTSTALVAPDATGVAHFVARVDGILAGTAAATAGSGSMSRSRSSIKCHAPRFRGSSCTQQISRACR